ncbi:hypothetical protein L207DRAFT_605448 [Hyaloscypha variabilis F]|uniref:Uncharacterized protein n=1 Tax=Hyaloscypha variabilis (strain UAMH 11265 / GT02V1 / F) TaxID=1149755 RepID=A0A2J6R584_HYAVF|nr:hypothetical protein L207DRAFT_605448 [Hyaloscypha variabilis F]
MNRPAKMPLRPCPKCPHRLSDLWTHEEPAEATQSAEAPKGETSTKDGDSETGSSSTAVEDCVHNEEGSRLPPEYPDTASERSNPPEYSGDENSTEEEYHVLRSEDEHESSDEHETEEHYKTAKEDQSDEEHLLKEQLAEEGSESGQEKKCSCKDDETLPAWWKCWRCEPWMPLKLEGEARKDVKLLPEWYFCICGETHGTPTESEKIAGTFANEELGESWETNEQYMLNRLHNQPTIEKLCGKCRATIAETNQRLREWEAEKALMETEKEEQGDQQSAKPETNSEVKLAKRPLWFTCYCQRKHGCPRQIATTEDVNSGAPEGEPSSTVGDKEVRADEFEDEGVLGTFIEDGRWGFWKDCDKCAEFAAL